MCRINNETENNCCGHGNGGHSCGNRWHMNHEHGEGCCERHGRPDHGRGEGGPCHGGRGPHMGPHRPMDEETYRTLDNDAKLGMLFHRVHRMNRFFFEYHGGQHRILAVLAHDGDMTQRELTEKLGIQPGSASELIGKLERSGWITRTESDEDRRTADVHLTESGKAHLDESRQHKPELFSALNDDEKAQLVSLLEKLCADWREKLFAERKEMFDRSGRPDRFIPRED